MGRAIAIVEGSVWLRARGFFGAQGSVSICSNMGISQNRGYPFYTPNINRLESP